jgi:hypothetical protein
MRGYRGVSRSPHGFVVRLRVPGRRIVVGRYGSLNDACDAYDAKVIEIYGPLAITNATHAEEHKATLRPEHP